ncbi:unnamed protein product [Chironomus riparius]|uniref:ABC transporter domain-containing protein n=1 Tax=Chironomus riparius TaxID=315576 RepID=A0A9N9RPU7_9DIPT|nr:unnamed protein product [Chironomus riparius]
MSFAKLRILLWKNWILQKRRPISGIFQIVFPIIIVVITAWMKNSIQSNFNVYGFRFEGEFSLSNFSMCNKTLERVFYYPQDEAYDKLLKNAFRNHQVNITGFNDRSVMDDEYWMINEPIEIASIQFFGDILTPSVLPKILIYGIDTRTYDLTCITIVQNAVERSFLEISSNSNINLKETTMNTFPFDDQVTQIFTGVMLSVLPIFLIFSMFSMVATVVKAIASERQSKMKELMKIMGLSSVLHWLSWFIKCLIMTTITYTIVTVFLCLPIIGDTAIFGLSNFFIVWLFLFFYCIGVITFCFLVSTFFSKASSAANVGVMLFFTTFVPYYVYSVNFENMNYAVKWFFLLPINTSFGQGISMLFSMELNQIGINFSNLFSHYEGFNFSLGEVMIAMVLSAIIHVLLTFYIEKVFPGDVGIPQPWHFPITSIIKMIRKTGDKSTTHDTNNVDYNFTSHGDFEEEPKHLNAKVRIVNMTRKFGKFTAVNNLSLNIYEDQITVLLGHNGGGKTTTMNVLTGMLPPTNGTAYINDFDIRTNIVEARKSLGICPQHNILFNDLTVSEHIIFFCKLKGMQNDQEIKFEIQRYLEQMGFMDKKNELSKTLSGGQKRKLSIANALCGNSNFVVLDEPTSGLDVHARRSLWDLLIAEKKNRTILLTTHYMDEAEVLGDRIAIMSDGMLKTVGTSFFLKKKFGSGYRLIVVKSPNCDSSIILDAVSRYAPDVTIESEEQLEVIFVLNDEYIDKFESIFRYLEEHATTLGIQSLGCSLATLEEVFLKVGDHEHIKPHLDHEVTVKFNNIMSFTKVSTVTLMLNQMYAMFLKKIHFTRRYYVILIIYTILSAWFLFVFLAGPTGPSGTFDFYDEFSGLVQTNKIDSSIVGVYTKLFNGSLVTVIDREVRDYIFGNFLRRNQRYQIGATFGEATDTIWYNFHSYRGGIMPVALNHYHRAALIESLGDEYDIRNHYNPFEWTYQPDPDARNQFDDLMVYVLFFLMLMYWPSLHITLKIKERVSASKLLQFISGVNRFLFTFVSFIIDTILTLIVLFIILGIVVAINRPGFNTTEDMVIYLTAFTFYTINVIPFIYVMSFWFKKHTTGETIVALFPLAFAILYVGYSILDQIYFDFIDKEVTEGIASVIYWFGIFFGPFSMIDIFVKLQQIMYNDNEGEIWSFGKRGMGINLAMMGAGGALFMTIVLLKDYFIFAWIKYKLSSRNLPLPPISSADDDVIAEIERVRSKTATEIIDSNLVLRGLTKVYGKHLAVNQLHVGVEPAECFGLLGVNGAGKTSVFKMLTGDEMISSGNAWIRGYSLINEIPKVYEKIGYCPQYDALLSELTGRETIKIFCLFRGVPRDEIDDLTEAFANELDFTKYLDITVGAYSGGNMRKLSTCLSLLGNLSLVFLDECSSGIDARAKRQLWNIIKKARNAGKAIVISSHSMQECESLCTRLAIMVDGEFQCIGSIQHIKNKFSKGFILKIMMTNRDDENLFQAIQQRVVLTFPQAQFKERFMGLLTFHIDVPDLKWSEVFGELSKMKTELGINDYTLTQSSLESVFLFFSQQGKRKVE